ncbi:hypothetical protein LshimejAT787_0602150 [Lyophyllum shimeji]|uniref:Uncharacterized protein n=1 Tax=Lyophyllum shimeji TaxID=47721 RepID=A0A9P3UMW7_LYOSH|nr:hypothetical protein LshimejAT787_0602150 [Lyophyllum shimeji]
MSGLCRGLPKINPKRLILWDSQDSRPGENAPTRKPVETISECITSWKLMETLEYPWENLDPPNKAIPIAFPDDETYDDPPTKFRTATPSFVPLASPPPHIQQQICGRILFLAMFYPRGKVARQRRHPACVQTVLQTCATTPPQVPDFK